MNFKSSLALTVIALILVSIFSPAVSASIVYGPVTFERTGGSPAAVQNTFSLDKINGNYTLYIKNGDGVENLSSSSLIRLNGETAVKTNEFNQNVHLITKNISVQQTNQLEVEMRSIPGSSITLWVEDETPVIRILTPWDDTASNEPVKVSGTVTDLKISNLTLNHNGNISVIPVVNRNFSSIAALTDINNITLSAIDSVGTLRSATLLLDGDMLPESYERLVGFDPHNPDSDASLTQENEAGNGIKDGYEMNGGQLPSFVKSRIGADPFKNDTDGDGLTDHFELMKLGLLTDIRSIDSDSDGLPDAEEDPDNDGPTNLQEQSFGTDPLVSDTDKDSLPDGLEVSLGTNPLLKDTDNDRLNDDSELRLGTNPLNTDTDGDGILDGDEIYTSIKGDDTPGVKASITGKGDIAKELKIYNVTSRYFNNISALVSPVFDFKLNGTFETAEITLLYDAQKASDPSNLSLFYFNESLGTFVQIESTVDAANHTVTGSTSHFSTFAIFSVPIWNAMFEAEMNMGENTSFTSVTIFSDTTNEWWNGSAWQPASPTWVHPGWPSISGATWIWTSHLVDSEDKFGPFTFRNTFRIPDNAVNITGSIRITADNAYRLYSNGQLIAQDGIVRSPPAFHQEDSLGSIRWQTIESYTIPLQRGLNEISVEAVNYRGGVGPYSNPAGLIYRADISYNLVSGGNDTDEDGLPDALETGGFRDGLGNWYVTDQNDADTDGDGLSDGEEAGSLVEVDGRRYFNIISKPTLVDSDYDSIADSDEEEFGTSPLNPDYDKDGLKDGFELEIGTDPLVADTDYDGFDDYEEHYDPNYDPLVYEKRYSLLEISRDVVLGAVLGEWGAENNDSLYYFAGWMLSGFIAVGDIRDIAASITRGDGLGTLLNALSLIPLYGDAAKVTATITKFVAKHPNMMFAAASFALKYIDDSIIWVKASIGDNVVRNLNDKGFSDDVIVAFFNKGWDLAKFDEILTNHKIYESSPDFAQFLKKQIVNGEILSKRVTFDAKKIIAAEKAGDSRRLAGYLGNIKGAYGEYLAKNDITGAIILDLKHINKGGIDYASMVGGDTLKIVEAKARKALARSDLKKNYLIIDDNGVIKGFNVNYVIKELGEDYFNPAKNPYLAKQFVLYLNGPNSQAIKNSLNLPVSLPYKFTSKMPETKGQEFAGTVDIVVMAVNK